MKNNIVPFTRALSSYEEKLEYERELVELLEETQEECDRLLDEVFLLGLTGEKLSGWLRSLRATQERVIGYRAELYFLDLEWEE